MDRFDAITAFVAVARAGGFSAAGRVLGVPVATVSRNVALLESNLGARLFTRSTRHVALTEAGRGYFEACSRVLDDLRDADEQVAGEYHDPKGELAVTAPLGFGHRYLQPVVHEFLRAYPRVELRLLLVDRVVALVEEHVDCALRISALDDSTLVARSLGHIRMVACAAPAYLAACGTPAHPEELQRHDCVSWTALAPSRTWNFRLQARAAAPQAVPVRVRLSTTTPESAVQAAVAGLGIVQATSYQLALHVARGELVPVLRAFEADPTPVSLVYPGKRLAPLKLRAFLDFAAPRLQRRLEEVAEVL